MVVDAASGEVLGGTLQQVYVYEAPVRIWHWVMMISMIVLVATGYLIGSPWSGPSREATFTYFFGNVRLIHFLAAAVFVVAFVVRRVLGDRRQPPRALDLPAAGVERQLVERHVPAGAVLPVHEEGAAAVDRAQPARAAGDVRDVRARHVRHHPDRPVAVRGAVRLGFDLDEPVRLGQRAARRVDRRCASCTTSRCTTC